MNRNNLLNVIGFDNKCPLGTHPSKIDQSYGYRILNQEIKVRQNFVFSEQHEIGKTNSDVVCVYFENCILTVIPRGVTKIFWNIEILEIFNSKLNEITKNDLAEFKNLKKFRCDFNQLKFLPYDLFEGFGNLEFISFYNNNLTTIEPNILDGLQKLKYVDFRKNPNYSKFYSVLYGNEPNASLKEVKVELLDKFSQKCQCVKILRAELEKEKLKNVEFRNAGFFGDIKAFLQDESTKDIKIIINDHEFPVHKFLITARSPTLAELLKNNPEAENLELVGIRVDIFEKILKFLYNDEFPANDTINFSHLFAAAGKLKIKNLKDYAAKKLINNIKEENELKLLNLSSKYDHKELKQEAFQKIKKKYPTFKIEDEWVDDPEKLEKIIEIVKQREESERKTKEKFKKMQM